MWYDGFQIVPQSVLKGLSQQKENGDSLFIRLGDRLKG